MDRFINRLLRIFRKKYFAIVFLFVCLISILGVTYSYWAVESGWNLASELKFKELEYLMRVDDVSTDIITSPANSGTVYYTIAVTSLNEINTRYSLTYKSNVSGVTVKTSTSSLNDANGIIGLYESGAGGEKTKIIKIAITNTTASVATINLEVLGGYSWNPETDIVLTAGYSRITETHTETQIEPGLLLYEELNRIMGCTPTSSSACLLKENSTNYLSYSDHTWRIIGTYLVGGEYLVKLVLDEPLSAKVSYANVNSELTTFFNTLDTSLIKTGAPFTCTGTTNITCTGSENIGLVSKAEYDSAGGVNSYLYTKPNKEYWLGDSYYIGTSRGIENKDNATTAYVRPAIYLKENTIDIAKSNSSIPITNLIVNGSFERGQNGWTSVSGQTVTIIGNGGVNGGKHVKLEPTATQRYLKNDTLVNIPIGNKFYVSAYYKKSGGGNAAYRVYHFEPNTNLLSVAVPNDAINWTKISQIATNTSTESSGNPLIYGAYTQFVQDMVTYWDNILLVDLTATFGAGNEPSKEWCDANIDYFDETSSILLKSGTIGTIANPYEISSGVYLAINLNGAIANIKSGYYEPGTYPITLNRYGYNFDGWTISSEDTSIVSNSLNLGSTDTVLTANWTLITYDIAYTLNEGVSSNPTTYTLFDLPLTLSAPTKTNYVFNGWTGSNGTTPQTIVVIDESNAGDKSYTANFTCTCVYYLGCTGSYVPVGATTSNQCSWRHKVTDGCYNTESSCTSSCPGGSCTRGSLWCCYVYQTDYQTRTCPTGSTQAGLYCRLYNQTSCESPYSVEAL